MNVRKPTYEEVHQVGLLEAKKMVAKGTKPTKDDYATMYGWLENSFIAVTDEYQTDCPGYVGKVMTIVWCGSPGFYSCYTWDKDGNIEEVIKEN